MLKKRNLLLEETLFGGQSFLWEKREDSLYFLFSAKDAMTLRQQDEFYEIDKLFPTKKDYFAEESYEQELQKLLEKKDKHLSEAVRALHGLRVLKQDLEDLIFTFILSSNNRIDRIRNTVQCIKNKFAIKRNDELLYPGAEIISKLKEEDLRNCGAGFRAGYMIESAKKFKDLEKEIKKSYDNQLVEILKELPGVGDKIADCIAVFSGRAKIFSPIDTWAKKILNEFYGVEYKKYEDYRKWWADKFGDSAYLAGQFLFEHYRKKR